MTTLLSIILLFSINQEIKLDNNYLYSNADTIIYNGGKPILTFIDVENTGDTLKIGKEYLLKIIIPDVPPENYSIAVTKGLIKTTEKPGIYKYIPKEEGQAIITFGFFYRIKERREFIEERNLSINKH